MMDPSSVSTPPQRGQWKASGGLHQASGQPPLPPAVKVGGIAALGVLLIAAMLLGVLFGGGFAPRGSASPTPTPELILDPPIQVGAFVRGETESSQVPDATAQRIVHAAYKDGANEVLFIMTWPESDLTGRLDDAGIAAEAQEPTEEGDKTLCGTSVDSSLPGCGRVVKDTVLILISIQGTLTQPSLLAMLDEFESAVTP